MRKFGFLSVLCVLTSISTGCAKFGANLVQNPRVQTSTKEDGKYLELKARLNTGILQFGGTLPLADPRNSNEKYGTVGVTPASDGSGLDLDLAINVAKASREIHVNLVEALPNGNPVPVAFTGDAPIIGVQAGERSRAYFSIGSDGGVLIGLALVVREFDRLSALLPFLNVFPGFNVGEQVRGVAGLFTGTGQDMSGIALFVHTQVPVERSFSGSPVDIRMEAMAARNTNLGSVTFSESAATRRQERVLDRELDRMSSQTLTIY